MDEHDWKKSSGDFRDWTIGRLDAKSDQLIISHVQQARDLTHIRLTTDAMQRAQQHLITALEKSTQIPKSPGVAPVPVSPPTSTDDTPSFLMSLLRHFGPKALMWALGRAFGILIQYLLPAGLLVWAMTQKWLGIVLHWLAQLLP